MCRGGLECDMSINALTRMVSTRKNSTPVRRLKSKLIPFREQNLKKISSRTARRGKWTA